MHPWGSIFFIISLTLIITACSPKTNQPLAKSVPTPSPTNSPDAKAFVNELPLLKPSPIQPSTTPQQGIQLPEIDPLKVQGNMIMAGSSTIFPLSQAMYERFIEAGYSGILKLDSIGSGAGFRLFCQSQELDLIDASRPIKADEIQACAKINRKPIAFRVATDALAIVVNPANDFLSNVTLKELAAIFTAEKWSDVNPKWPNEKILRFVPDTNSGTLDFFVKKVFDYHTAAILRAPNTEFSSDDEELVEGVSANQYAIGFFGHAYYQRNSTTLKILSIDGIRPNAKSVEAGHYPLTRPLFIYSDANIIRHHPQVGSWINFYLTHVNEEVSRVGYFPANPKALDEAKTNLLKVIGQAKFLGQDDNS